MTDEEQKLLTTARTESWRIEHQEFAYDAAVHRLISRLTQIEFLGVGVSLCFLYFQYVVPDTNIFWQWLLSIVGTGLSVLLILAVFWTNLSQWKAKIDKMRELSSSSNRLIVKYRSLRDIRPIPTKEIQEWLQECKNFDDKRKDPLSAVTRSDMKKGFHHVGKLHSEYGVICGTCEKKWTNKSALEARWRIFSFSKCPDCGI